MTEFLDRELRLLNEWFDERVAVVGGEEPKIKRKYLYQDYEKFILERTGSPSGDLVDARGREEIRSVVSREAQIAGPIRPVKRQTFYKWLREDKGVRLGDKFPPSFMGVTIITGASKVGLDAGIEGGQGSERLSDDELGERYSIEGVEDDEGRETERGRWAEREVEDDEETVWVLGKDGWVETKQEKREIEEPGQDEQGWWEDELLVLG